MLHCVMPLVYVLTTYKTFPYSHTYINQMFEYVCECYRNNIIIIRSRVEYEHRYQVIRILLSHKRCSRGVILLDSNRSQIWKQNDVLKITICGSLSRYIMFSSLCRWYNSAEKFSSIKVPIHTDFHAFI